MAYGLVLLQRCWYFARRNLINCYFFCARFEPKSHMKSRLSLIVRVNVVLNRTVDVNNLCLSHLFLREDDCHPTLNLYSFTNNGWSLLLLEETWQQLFFLGNKFMSSCVICLVILREIFLLQWDIFRHIQICAFFPLKCLSLRQPFKRIIQARLFTKHLHHFCCWFEWLERS